MYVIIQKYERFYASTGIMDTTAHQCSEKLDRIFRVLTEDYGVIMHDDHIDGLDGRVLSDYYSLLAQGRKMSTRNNYVCFLNPFLRWAYKTKIISEDLSDILATHKLPSENTVPEWERKNKYISPDEVSLLLTVMPGRNKVRDRAIIAFFLGTGLRVSEMCSLTLGSVLDSPRGDVYCKRKGGSWEHVLVADFVYPYLEEYLKTRNDLDNHKAPLFVTTHGNAANPNQIYKAIAFKQRSLNLATGPHNFRHTFVSEVEKIGGAAVARDVANHKSIRVTNRYDHTTQDQRVRAIKALRLGAAEGRV